MTNLANDHNHDRSNDPQSKKGPIDSTPDVVPHTRNSIDSSASFSDKKDPDASFDRMLQGLGVKQEEREVLATVNKIGEDAEAGYTHGKRTVDTPTYRAFWEGAFAPEHFQFTHEASPPDAAQMRQASIDVAKKYIKEGAVLGADGKLNEEMLKELGPIGWWGQMVKEKFGGLGLPKVEVAKNMTEMSAVNPYLGGLASVHGSIGLVYPIGRYGTEEQQRQYLPLLASGEKLSAFALTEPSVGTDVSLIKAKVSQDGDHYILNGEKLFITNAAPGRLVGVVTELAEPITTTINVNGKEVENTERRAVLIVQLPASEQTDDFEIRKYNLAALKPIYNQGLVFKDFKVPIENKLDPTELGTRRGDGLTIGFTGLNNGRLAVLANSSGAQRSVLANIIPWLKYRSSFGKPLEKHSHVQEMVGRMAANVVATEGLRDWVAQLMDQGFNCEMEAMNAKIFGSEAQDQTTEYFLKLQGGRSFLEENSYIENLIESKACKIYEGENGVLHLGHDKQILDDFNKRYAQVLADPQAPMKQKVATAFALGSWLTKRGFNWIGQKLFATARSVADSVSLDRSPKAQLNRMTHFAEAKAQNYWLKTFATFARYGGKLPREETVIRQRAAQKMTLINIKALAEWGKTHPDPLYQQAILVKCKELQNKYLGRTSEEARPDADSRFAADLGRKVLKHGLAALEGVPIASITKPYNKDTGQELPRDNSYREFHIEDFDS